MGEEDEKRREEERLSKSFGHERWKAAENMTGDAERKRRCIAGVWRKAAACARQLKVAGRADFSSGSPMSHGRWLIRPAARGASLRRSANFPVFLRRRPALSAAALGGAGVARLAKPYISLAACSAPRFCWRGLPATALRLKLCPWLGQPRLAG